ncbi:MAG: hypothetical protein GC161_12350 [Planctomycetaceae bacterium]|nr:hypothetical protein [Planctomycetaceae bacterium]
MQTPAPSPLRRLAALPALSVLLWCAACGTDRGSTEISQDTRRWVESRAEAASYAKPVEDPGASKSDDGR